jgi:hypothetical protein
VVERLRAVARTLSSDGALTDAIARQDAATSHRIVSAALFGA